MKEAFRLIVRDDSPRETEPIRGKWMIAVDLLLAAALLFGFAYLHHVRARVDEADGLVSLRSGKLSVLSDSLTDADDGGEAGHFAFEGHFCDEPFLYQDEFTAVYRDSGCEITLKDYYLSTGAAHVADVYVSDIGRLATAMANDRYGRGQREDFEQLAMRSGAVFSVTGDQYAEREGGAILRNGILYSDEADRDVCVLNWDGTVDLYRAEEFDLTDVMEKSPYQIWSFGPILLDENGRPAGTYPTELREDCRRAAFGYFEPGHYCFVILDGRASLDQLAQNMSALGCKSAYALYGGQLAGMRIDCGGYHITTTGGQRSCSDIILIRN